MGWYSQGFHRADPLTERRARGYPRQWEQADKYLQPHRLVYRLGSGLNPIVAQFADQIVAQWDQTPLYPKKPDRLAGWYFLPGEYPAGGQTLK